MKSGKLLISVLLMLTLVLGIFTIASLHVSAASIDAGAVSINGKSFSNTRLYYKNGAADVTDDSENYNAYYDPAGNTLTLNNYNGDCIAIGGAVTGDVNIVLIGNNTITTSDQSAISNINGGGIYITSEDSASLTINSNASQSNVYGVYTGTWGSGALDIGGMADVTINVNTMRNDAAVYGAHVNGTIDVNAFSKLTVTISSQNTNSGVSVGTALYAKQAITLNTTNKIRIDTSGIPSLNGNIGIYSESGVNLKNAEELKVIVNNGTYAVPVYPASSVNSWTSFDSSTGVGNGVLTTTYTPKNAPAVSAAGVVSWEEFGDDEYTVRVTNSQSQLVLNQSVGYNLSFDLKEKLEDMDAPADTYKITVSSKKNGSYVYSSAVSYSYTSSKAQLDTPDNLYWDGAVAKWDEVANATSYNVVLTDGNGGALISKTISATSYDFADNIKNGAIFKVVAKADGYLDSAEAASDPSKSFVVKFLAGNGTGSKDKEILTPVGDDTEVEYTMPGPGGFYAPSGKIFSRWSVDFVSGPQEDDPSFFAKSAETITVDGDLLLTATWKDEAYTVTLYANDGKGTQQAVEDVIGAYVLPNCPFDAPDGKEFDCWAIGGENGDRKVPGQGINVTNDTLIVAIWRDKAFTVQPKNTTLATNENYVFDYEISVEASQINIQYYTGSTWEYFGILASPAPASNTLTSGTIYCPTVGWTGTRTLRLNAWDASSNQYYSDEFTVTWIPSVFETPILSVTVPLDKPVLITYSLNIDPDSLQVQVYDGYAWEFSSGADSKEYTVLSAYDTEITKTYRIVAVKDGNPFYSNEFTVEWSESADAYAFDTTFNNATLKPGEANYIPWSVSFASTSQSIYVWNEEYQIWEHYDGDEEGIIVLRAANEVNDFDFQSNSEITLKFKIVARVGDDFAIESNEFTLSWVYYNATFKANGGEGDDVIIDELYGEYILPECTFTAPAGKAFAGWAAGSAEGTVYSEGEAYDLEENTTFYAVWEDYTLVDTYAKLMEAINAGKRYIKLTANVSHVAYENMDVALALICFSGNGKTVLDLGGYTLNFGTTENTTIMSNTIAWIEVRDGHQLTIKNGTMILNNKNGNTDYTAYGMIYVNDAALITEGVNMQNLWNGSCVRAYSGAVTLNGGTLQNLNGWCVYSMYDVELTLDGDVCICLKNHANASSSLGGGLYVLTEDVTLNILKACIKDGMSIPKTLRPTLETHVFYVNGARIKSELGLYTTNNLAVDAGATTYWLDQGARIYLADAGDGVNYFANEYVVLTSKSVKHSITVENGSATVGGNEVNEGYYTQQITITADPIEGKVFDNWNSEGAVDIIFADPYSATTTFEMPDCDIKLIPVYKNAPISYVEIYISDPIIGDMITREAMLNHEALYFSTECQGNPDWDIQWNCVTDSITNMENGVFLPGKEYKALMQIKITDAEWNDWSIDPSLTVMVNGMSAEVTVYGEKTANVFITFQTSNADLDVSFTEDSRAGLGGWLKVDTEKLSLSSEFANAERVEYIWVKDGEFITGATDSSYKIKPEDANSEIYVLVKTEWNGINYYGLSEVKTVNHKISVVYINFDPFEGGCYVPNNSHKLFQAVDTELGKVQMVVWYNDVMTEMEAGDLIEAGKDYNLFVVYQLNEGYVWADDIVFCFNGGDLVTSDAANPTDRTLRKLLSITPIEHTHTYEKEIYGIDEYGHWLRCDNELCANRDEEDYQYVDHVSNDATCQTTGSCAICGKEGIEGTHDFHGGEYVKINEEYHETKCLYCDATDNMQNPHLGGTATCKSGAVCDGCGEAYGELDADNHTGIPEWTKTETKHTQKYSCCGAITVPEADHDMQGGECTICGYGCTHTSATKKNGQGATCTENGWLDYYQCDNCSDLFTTAECTVKIDNFESWKTGDGLIPAIDHDYGDWESNGDGTHTGVCSNNPQHTDTDDCYGGTATCTEQAICSGCGEKYGNTAPHNYTVVNGYKEVNGHADVCSCGAHDTPVAHTPDRQAATENDPVKCTVCQYIITPATGHVNHTPKDGWRTDGEYHWQECTGCEGQQLNKAAHTGGTATCTAKAECSVCGEKYGDTAPHSYTTVNGYKEDDGHANVCSCGAHDTPVAHTPDRQAATENDPVKCTVCDYVIAPATGHVDHTPKDGWRTDGEYHWQECTGCEGQQLNKAAHTGGTATCTEKAVCSVCNTAYGLTAEHAYGSEWKNNADGHWNECACTAKANEAAHADGNGDGRCDVCDCEMPAHTPENPENPDNTPEKDKGLGAGAITGIVIGSVAVVGASAFSVVWFVVLKKSFADLGAAFVSIFGKIKDFFVALFDKIKGLFVK